MMARWRSITYERWMILLTLLLLVTVGGFLVSVVQGIADDVHQNRVLIQVIQADLEQRNRQLIEQNTTLIDKNKALIDEAGVLIDKNRLLIQENRRLLRIAGGR
jgi:hypothetical protein